MNLHEGAPARQRKFPDLDDYLRVYPNRGDAEFIHSLHAGQWYFASEEGHMWPGQRALHDGDPWREPMPERPWDNPVWVIIGTGIGGRR